MNQELSTTTPIVLKCQNDQKFNFHSFTLVEKAFKLRTGPFCPGPKVHKIIK